MKYSVIIPAYQCQDTITNTVVSIEESGLEDFEIIIVNDGSSDGTEGRCKQLQKEYSNIIYHKQPNTGVSGARNHGLSLAKGEYIWFFDSDDTVDQKSLTRICTLISNYCPDILIFGMSFDYYHGGSLYRRDIICYPTEKYFSRDEFFEDFTTLYNTNSLTSSCNKLIKRQILVDNKILYDNTVFLMEDFLFMLDVIQYCNSLYIVPEGIYHYRQTEDEGNVYRRISRICSLKDFIVPFQERLRNQQEVLSYVYYMLLNQKIWCSSLNQIRKIAEDHKRVDIAPVRSGDVILNNDLQNGKIAKIFWNNKKLQIRHKLANTIKQTSIYRLIKMRRNHTSNGC